MSRDWLIAFLLASSGTTAFASSWCLAGRPEPNDPLRSFINREGITKSGSSVTLSVAFLKQRLAKTTDGEKVFRDGKPFNEQGVWSVWARMQINCPASGSKLLSMHGYDVNGSPIDSEVRWDHSAVENSIHPQVIIEAVCNGPMLRKHLQCTPFSFNETEVFRPTFSEPSRSERREAIENYRRATSFERRPH